MYKADIVSPSLGPDAAIYATMLGSKTVCPQKQSWDPYDNNGGSICAIAGKGFVVIASDTRLSKGYSILSRKVSKVEKINDHCLLAGGGMQSDRNQLAKAIRRRCQKYEFDNFSPISTAAAASLLSTELYSRRFFPYYVFSVVAGLDSDGNGVLYTYDAIGSFEKVDYTSQGSGSILAYSFLDNQAGFLSQPSNKRELSLAESIELLKVTITSLCERDIYTGDEAEIWVLTSDGVEKSSIPLRKD